MNASTPEERIEMWFLIPLVRNSDKEKHMSTLWGLLREEIYGAAGGESNRRTVIEDMQLWPGSWRDPKTGLSVADESRKYTVILARSKESALREVLERAANSFDQEEVLFVVQGVDRTVKRDKSKGFLNGDPTGG